MIKIDKKRIELQGKNLDEIKKIIDKELTSMYENCQLEAIDLGGIDWFPTIISFSLGAITSGILKEIGKDIWVKLKNLLIDSKQEAHIPKFEFEFEHQGIEIIAVIESNDPADLKQAFDNLGEIWDRVVDLVDDEDKDKLRLVLDLEEGCWKNKKL